MSSTANFQHHRVGRKFLCVWLVLPSDFDLRYHLNLYVFEEICCDLMNFWALPFSINKRKYLSFFQNVIYFFLLHLFLFNRDLHNVLGNICLLKTRIVPNLYFTWRIVYLLSFYHYFSLLNERLLNNNFFLNVHWLLNHLLLP